MATINLPPVPFTLQGNTTGQKVDCTLFSKY